MAYTTQMDAARQGIITKEMAAVAAEEHIAEETLRELCGQTPLCRIGKPEEVAAAVLFFASDAAGFITGQMLGVDGGFAI